MSTADPRADVRCPSCGYSLYGLTHKRCPECGFQCGSANVRGQALADAERRSDAAGTTVIWSIIAISLAAPALLERFSLSRWSILGLMIAVAVVILCVLCRYFGLTWPLPMSERSTWVLLTCWLGVVQVIVALPIVGVALASVALIEALFSGTRPRLSGIIWHGLRAQLDR